MSCFFPHNIRAGCTCGISLWAGHSRSSHVNWPPQTTAEFCIALPAHTEEWLSFPLAILFHHPGQKGKDAFDPTYAVARAPRLPGNSHVSWVSHLPLALEVPVLFWSRNLFAPPKQRTPGLAGSPAPGCQDQGLLPLYPAAQQNKKPLTTTHTPQGHRFWKHHTSQIFLLLCDSQVAIF